VSRARPIPLLVALAALFVAGCPSTTTSTPYTPITGILIRSSTLVAGHGCGTGANQVYKYAAVVSYETDAGGPSAPITSGVFDCFTDGIISNLPASDNGSSAFDIQIYAYDATSFDLPSVSGQLQCGTNAQVQCPGDIPANVVAVEAQATWTTNCTATQQQGVSSVAACGPLEPTAVGVQPDAGQPDAGADAGLTQITIATSSFSLQEGGAIACGTAYDSANAFFLAGAQMGQTTPSPCPTPLLITPATPNASYQINLYLLKSNSVVATATCTATTVLGATVAASCGPATLN